MKISSMYPTLMLLNGTVTLIGLTGGIAAGKSTIANRFAQLGATIIDADRVAREVVEPGQPALAAVADRFGGGVVAADGSLDRAALGRVIFGDAKAKADLEEILHPAIQARVSQLIADALASDPNGIVVYDIPLLVETMDSTPLDYDAVVVAHAPAAVRLERLISIRGMERSEAQRRIDAQASDAERLRQADHVIRTDLPIEETMDQVDTVWNLIHG